MKTAAATAIAAASLLIGVAFAAPAAGGGVATHYTVHCADAAGTTVDRPGRTELATSERPGGKAHAIELFKQSNPGGHCWISGPHRDRPGTADSRLTRWPASRVHQSFHQSHPHGRFLGSLRAHSVAFGASRRLADERRLRHAEKLVLSAAVGALVLAAAPAALAGPNRADACYTVHCTDPGGNPTRRTSRSTPTRSSRAASSARSPTSTPTTRAGPAGPRARQSVASQHTLSSGGPAVCCRSARPSLERQAPDERYAHAFRTLAHRGLGHRDRGHRARRRRGLRLSHREASARSGGRCSTSSRASS